MADIHTETRVTAIVCTHNRADMLARAIDSLATQSLPDEQYEILIVDNGSTDNTSELVHERAARLGNLRYISEPELGLSRARNTGLKQARAAFAAFMDDDATASPRWLEGICRAFLSRRPQPGLVCGPVTAEWGGTRPSWLKDYWLPFYSIVYWSPHARCLAADEWPVGTNFAVPTSLAIRCSGFDTSLGRRGSALLGDEELALADNIRSAGYEIFYDPDIRVAHYIPAERLSRRWFYKRVYWGAVSASMRKCRTLNSKLDRYQRAAQAAWGALCNACSLRQIRESDAERMLRYQLVAEKLGQIRGYLTGSARFS